MPRVGHSEGEELGDALPKNDDPGGRAPVAWRSGKTVRVRALKADGQPYRWWTGSVETQDANHISVLTRVGDVVEGIPRGWVYRHHSRSFYWFDRPYNLAEVYEPDGRLKQLYVHIASPAVLVADTVTYVDHELDVILRPGQPPRVADQDEFEAAAREYRYDPEFQQACWRAVDEALNLVDSWDPVGWGRPSPRTRWRRFRDRRSGRRGT